MSDRAETVLATALNRLVTANTIDQPQADAVRTEFGVELRRSQGQPEKDASWSSVLMEVGGYVGAAFIVAAVVALVGPRWESLSLSTQATLFGGPAVLMLIAAVSIAMAMPGGWAARTSAGSGPRRRLISVLVLASGGLLGALAALFLDDAARPDRVVALVLLAAWGIGYALFYGAVLHLATASALSWAITSLITSESDQRLWISGLVLVLVAAIWAGLSLAGVIREQALGLATAGVMAFSGAQYVISDDDTKALGYVLLAALAVAGLVGYVMTRELSALGVGGATLAVVVPQAVIDYSEGSLGAAGALLISGLSIVGASALGLRLRKEDDEPATPAVSSGDPDRVTIS